MPGHGLLVTKVKYNAQAWQQNVVNTEDAMHVDIQEAAGKKSFFGNDTDPFPGAKKVTSYVPVGKYDLSDIQENDGVVSFKFMGGADCPYRHECFTEHCQIVSETACTAEGESYAVKLCPDFGYELLLDDDHFIVMMGDADLTPGDDYSFADSVLTVPNVTGRVSVYAVATQRTVEGCVALCYDLVEGVVPQKGSVENRYIAKDEPFTEVWLADECYEILTDDNLLVEVKVGDAELPTAYDVADGRLTITLSPAQLTDNVSIAILATAQPTVYFDGEHCALNGALCVGRDSTYSATITTDVGYRLTADNLMITMDDDDLELGEDFTFRNGLLTIRKVDGDIEIVAIATSMPSALPEMAESEPVVAVCGDVLRIEHLPQQAQVLLCDAVGRVLLTMRASASEVSCPLPDAGLYLVQIQCGSDMKVLKIIR